MLLKFGYVWIQNQTCNRNGVPTVFLLVFNHTQNAYLNHDYRVYTLVINDWNTIFY